SDWLTDQAAAFRRLVVEDDTCYTGYAAGTAGHFADKPPLTHRVRTNADGLRIAFLPKAEVPRRCRILCLGDSFTHGMWVSAEEAFPAQLEDRLNALGYSVRVDNGGMQGHTIAEERIDALGRWARLRPDLVIVSRTTNALA